MPKMGPEEEPRPIHGVECWRSGEEPQADKVERRGPRGQECRADPGSGTPGLMHEEEEPARADQKKAMVDAMPRA